jgi:hypothetical protein
MRVTFLLLHLLQGCCLYFECFFDFVVKVNILVNFLNLIWNYMDKIVSYSEVCCMYFIRKIL